MPLSPPDRRFLAAVDRLKVYLLVIALLVLCSLLFTPASEMQAATSVIGIALCGVFWLTQRLLSFITLLDFELTRVVTVMKRILPEEQRKELFPDQ